MTEDAQKRFTILRRKQVQERTGLSRSTIYLRVAQGTFPKAISLGARAVGWVDFVRAYERQPRRHIHAALVAAHRLDCGHAKQLWQGVIGRRSSSLAEVEPYEYGIGGLAYIMKSLDSLPEDIQFSRNLSAFSLGSGSGFFGRSREERRQVRRIRRQGASI